MTSLSTSTPSQSKMTRSTPGFGSCTRLRLLVVQRTAIQSEPVIDQLVAELAGDFGLQLFDLFVGEFDHLAVAQIDQMVVVAVAHLLVAGAAFAKIVAFDDAGVLEQLYRPIYRRDRDLVIDGDAAAIQFLDVGMIAGFRQHARDDAALLGHAHAGGGAAGLDAGGLERGRGFKCGHGFRLEIASAVVPPRAAYDKSRRIRSAFNCSPLACR